MSYVSVVAAKLRSDGSLSELIADVLERASETGEQLSLRALSVRYVRAVVDACQGNKSRAARVLGVSRRTLYRWLEREAG